MLNAINKTLIASVVAAACSLAACSDKELDGAMALYQAAETGIGEARYSEALATLDTLNARYPEQTQVRRDALRLRALAIQGLALDSIWPEARLLLPQQSTARHVTPSSGMSTARSVSKATSCQRVSTRK